MSISVPDDTSRPPSVQEVRSDVDTGPPNTDDAVIIPTDTDIDQQQDAEPSTDEHPSTRPTEELRSEPETPEHETTTSSDDDSDSTTEQLRRAIEEARSEIDPNNIMHSERNRKRNYIPNIGSFTGKKYHPEMLNIDNEAFEYFERGPQTALARQERNLFRRTVGICFNQMNARRGIRLYGERAIAAMFKEYKQLDDLEVLARIDPDSLTEEQKKKHCEQSI